VESSLARMVSWARSMLGCRWDKTCSSHTTLETLVYGLHKRVRILDICLLPSRL
jgi:hypothetical protein